MKLNTYLTFEDNCQDAFNLYKEIFGGEFSTVMKFSDIPPGEDFKYDEDEKDKLLHISMPIGKDSYLMGSDTPKSVNSKLQQGNNCALSLDTHCRSETERIFKALSEGGSITMPLEDTFWGAYYGKCIDRFGIHWQLNCVEQNKKPKTDEAKE